jgi:hypothetical protein
METNAEGSFMCYITHTTLLWVLLKKIIVKMSKHDGIERYQSGCNGNVVRDRTSLPHAPRAKNYIVNVCVSDRGVSRILAFSQRFR